MHNIHEELRMDERSRVTTDRNVHLQSKKRNMFHLSISSHLDFLTLKRFHVLPTRGLETFSHN